uniref:Uncharacterized protein n=1 Tax=Arion vulgaris TaxID=1028688 RepID=A0A0B7B7L6_9EUPU
MALSRLKPMTFRVHSLQGMDLLQGMDSLQGMHSLQGMDSLQGKCLHHRDTHVCIQLSFYNFRY